MVETNVSSFFDFCPLILRHKSSANAKKPINFGLMFKERLFLKPDQTMKKETILLLISGLIAAMFFYAAFSKLMDYDKSLDEMRNQIFPATIANILTWLIPTTEIMLTFLLLFPNTRKKALWASLVLLGAFTIYVGVVMSGVFGRIPCSCGGVLKNMSYGTHLMFNLFFVSLALLGLAIENGWILFNRFFNPKKRKDQLQNSG